MGKKWSEQTKVKVAAGKLRKKHEQELGPLFAGQAPAVDERRLRAERRMGMARLVEHEQANNPAASEAVAWLDWSEYRSLVELAKRHLSGDVVERLDAYARRTYPSVTYWHSFWLDVLSGRKRVPTVIRVTLHPHRVSRYNPEGRKVVEEGWLPPDGWAAPYGEEWRRTYFWRSCTQCKRWHAPGQAGCLPSLPAETEPPANLILARGTKGAS